MPAIAGLSSRPGTDAVLETLPRHAVVQRRKLRPASRFPRLGVAPGERREEPQEGRGLGVGSPSRQRVRGQGQPRDQRAFQQRLGHEERPFRALRDELDRHSSTTDPRRPRRRPRSVSVTRNTRWITSRASTPWNSSPRGRRRRDGNSGRGHGRVRRDLDAHARIASIRGVQFRGSSGSTESTSRVSTATRTSRRASSSRWPAPWRTTRRRVCQGRHLSPDALEGRVARRSRGGCAVPRRRRPRRGASSS